MKDLIEALTILLKYGNPRWPTHCEHDILTVCPSINPDKVSPEDITRLKQLGFFVSDEIGEKQFASHRFGSA